MIEAPHKSVYAALVDPEALVEWLPPEGLTGHFEHFDARGRHVPDDVDDHVSGMNSSLSNLAGYLGRHGSPL